MFDVRSHPAIRSGLIWLRERLLTPFLLVNPLVCLFLFVGAADALARAGGGGRYSGGRSGGGGGGGDGAIFLIFHLFRLCIYYPKVGIPVLVIGGPLALYVFYKSGSAARGHHEGAVIRRGRQMQGDDQRQYGIATLQSRDPAFAVPPFLDRVRSAFMQIQEAWCKQDMVPIRHFVSDGIFERFSLQFEEQKDSGYRNQMDKIEIHSADLVEVRSDAVFDTVTVVIQASAIDYYVDAETGKRVSGSRGSEPFTEYWSFLRRPGAQTLEEGGLIEGNCPNCGANLQLNEAAKCEACGALVRSGEYDWVLTEITQACEWRTTEDHEVPGLSAMQQTDPGFSLQHLEDRASVMFWRGTTARRRGHADPIRKFATEEFCAEIADRWELAVGGERHFPAECAVGSVETVGLILDDPWDRALVEVRWSSVDCVRKGNGPPKKTSAARLFNEIYVIRRQHGAQSDLGAAVSSAHCPSCGAAAASSTANACEYCGTVLNDGTADWVLEYVGPSYDSYICELRDTLFEQPETMAPQADGSPTIPHETGGQGGLELAAWMVHVMLADNEIDGKERALIDGYTSSRGIPPQQIEQLIAAVSTDELDAPIPQTPDEAQAWLEQMAEMALADGFVAKAEREAIFALGDYLDLSRYDVNQLILRKRRDLYQESKARIRELHKRD